MGLIDMVAPICNGIGRVHSGLFIGRHMQSALRARLSAADVAHSVRFARANNLLGPVVEMKVTALACVAMMESAMA
jgi:hypothetical protein